MSATASARWSANNPGNSAQPRSGDLATNAQGSSTAQLSNPNVVAALNSRNPATGAGGIVAPAVHTAPWAQPVPVWIALVVLMVIYHFVELHPKSGVDKAEILHVSVGNTLKVTILAVIGITFGKWVFGYWQVPGLSAIFGGV